MTMNSKHTQTDKKTGNINILVLALCAKLQIEDLIYALHISVREMVEFDKCTALSNSKICTETNLYYRNRQ